MCVWEIVANAVEKNLSDECVSTKLRESPSFVSV